MNRFTSWSPSRLADYESCPLNAKLKYLDKLCTHCFKGTLTGGYDSPAVCETCGEVTEPGPALVRGTRLHASLEKFVKGEGPLDTEINNTEVIEHAEDFRFGFKKGRVEVERSFIFDDQWNLLTGEFPAGAWLRTKIDILELHKSEHSLAVIDWKSGGIDKRTGKIRPNPKYDDQLSLYCLAALCALPTYRECGAALIFIDAPTGSDPVIASETTDIKTRREMKGLKKKWELRVLPMMHDEVFGPKPSPDACRFCPFAKDKGGPCPV